MAKMGTVYNIYFDNKSTLNQTYGLFSQPPELSGNTGDGQVYGNVFLSKKIAQDGNWSIQITKTYYAWCGQLPTKLAPGIVVSSGNGKLATLGTNTSPGSTWTMYNNSGSPAFQTDQKFTANPGAYEIDSGSDYTPEQNFVIGLAGLDDSGRLNPLAVLPGAPNTKVNIKPITRYWIGAFNSSVGTVVDTATASLNCADIDFSGHEGMFGAVVTQDKYGKFDVKYTSNQVNYQLAIMQSKAESLGLQWQFTAMKEFISFNEAYAAGNADVGHDLRYLATLKIQGTPTEQNAQEFFVAMSEGLRRLSWSYLSGTRKPNTVEILFAGPGDLSAANNAFQQAYVQVPLHVRQYFVDISIQPAPQPSSQAGPVPSLQAASQSSLQGTTPADQLSNVPPQFQLQKQQAMNTLQAQGFSNGGFVTA